MAKQAAAAHHGEGEPCEGLGHLDSDPARVFVLLLVGQRSDVEMVIAIDEIVGDLHERAAQSPIGTTAQRAAGAINGVALIA